MSNETILLLILIILVIGAVPSWPYSRPWGYIPMSILTIVLIVFFVWAITENRPLFRSAGEDLKSAVQDAGQDIKKAGHDVADSIRDVAK